MLYCFSLFVTDKKYQLHQQAVVQYMADLMTIKDSNPQQNDRKGFWHWVCSLCGEDEIEA